MANRDVVIIFLAGFVLGLLAGGRKSQINITFGNFIIGNSGNRFPHK